MEEYRVIISAVPLDDYKLLLTFDNGERREYDAKSLVENHKLFIGLKDLERFRQVYVKYGTVLWSEDLDLDPCELYEDSVLVEVPCE